ncbi:hypothetical protein FA95DRAFT_1679633 [Auriscalpium vulgare]|uniref:Uncharacterized protein n=1 Tax=Auriscalpium vulgare TaxID=40419 RepID=A0ACB8RS76_9AGAM|nr:hypothetical protein FA95DRAFT_1679633 [Auriscalpium vulgare]
MTSPSSTTELSSTTNAEMSMRAHIDAPSRDPTCITDAKSYWGDAATARIAQFPAIPRYPRHIDEDLRLVKEREESLEDDMAAFTRWRSYEENAMRAAMSAVQKRNRRHEGAIRNALLHARRLRNSLIPISLPDEILEKLFVLLFALEPPDRESVWCIKASTHVCSAWRRVALGYPPLWTTISLPLPSEKWVSAMVARSKSFPLSITATVGSDHFTPEWVPCLVYEYLPKTKSLRIDRLIPDAFDDIEIINSPRPMLEELVTNDPCPHFPNMIPAKYTPALRVLDVVTEVAFGWNAKCLRNLTSLKVNQDCVSPGLQEVVVALRGMPSLERFSLTLVPGFDNWRYKERATDRVQLPQLSHVYLNAPAGDLNCFLEKIRIPATASIHLVFQSWSDRIKPDAVAASICAFQDADVDTKPITKLSFSSTVPWSKSREYDSGVIMSAWRGTRRGYTPPIQLEFRNYDNRGAVQELMLSIFRAFVSDGLQELIMMDASWTEDTWKTALSCTPLLERIEAAGNACGTLCAALRSPDVVPTLIALKLRDAGFSSPIRGLSPSDGRGGAELLLEDVLSGWLSERAGARHPLERLDLRSSGIVSAAHLAQLRAALPNLLIIDPCTDPGGPISFHWRSSFKHKGASAPFLGSSCDTLLVCAHAPDPSDDSDSDSESAVLVPDELGVDSEGDSESEVIVLDELEVDDVDSVPHASEMLKTWDSYSYGERRLVF